MLLHLNNLHLCYGREERKDRWKKRRSERMHSEPGKKFMLGLTLELHLDSGCEPMFPSRTLAAASGGD